MSLVVGLGLAVPAGAAVLGPGAGLQVDAVREDLLVPLTFAGPGLRLRLEYAGHVGPGTLNARIDAGYGFLWDRFGNAAETITYGATVSWHVPISSIGRWRWSLGPLAAWDTRLNYLHRWDDSHRYWLGAQWLGPSARVATLVGGWRFEATATVALVGLESRPPKERFIKQEAMNQVSYYFRTPVRDEKLMTPADTQIVRVGLSARRSPSLEVDVAPGWTWSLETTLSRASRPATNINLGILVCGTRAWEL